MGEEYEDEGTEYALEVGYEDGVDGVVFDTASDMASAVELAQWIPGARVVERQWAVTAWTPVPAAELED